MATSKLTPMMRQYFKIKAQHKDVILFFQLGDFYETFFEDAELAARELDIVLTKRDEAPMAGVPIKKAHLYINRLLKKGYKVAICDQLQDPEEARGVVERDVVRIVTPGTVLDEEALERGVNNYIASLFAEDNKTGLAVVDLSTGEFRATELFTPEELKTELSRLQPAELVIPRGATLEKLLETIERRVALTEVEAHYFKAEPIIEHFNLISLDGLGLTPLSGKAAGGLLKYLKETQKEALSHLSMPSFYSIAASMNLDPFTQRNLELVRELRSGGEQGTLFSVLNKTVTGMGERLLRKYILSPLVDRAEIERRLDLVELLFEHGLIRTELREILKKIYDIERLAGRLGSKRATPRDLLSLKQSLEHLPALQQKLKEPQAQKPVAKLDELITTLESLNLKDLAEMLSKAIRDDAPFTLKEGNIIREGFDEHLDALKEQERLFKRKILELEARERERTHIPSLKVGYNTVFGYYLEVTKVHAKRVPPDYIRKQTLVNAERYVTEELKEYEEKILSAQEKSQELEYEIFCKLRDTIAERTKDIQKLAHVIAQLDVFASLAEVAKLNNYCRPSFTEKRELFIKEGRHPVVEVLQGADGFVPNDAHMAEDEVLVILTGPNMSGKSTWLRQVALICLMAQMGSFVPAKEAKLPIIDKIFTRVGASDMLAFGYSTFMVEMLETANILNNATEKSLVILDEMGRGTSTFDGVSIAWAVAEHLVSKVKAKTLFATHYHELTLLEEKLDGVTNMNVLVKEYGDQVIFLHKVAEGKAEGSYGVHVAKLAGLPKEVTDKASEILHRILQGNPLEAIEGRPQRGPKFIKQAPLFGAEPHPVIEELKKLDINSLTPIEALNLLGKLKEKL